MRTTAVMAAWAPLVMVAAVQVSTFVTLFARALSRQSRNARELTKGLNNRGADHPRWLPQRG